MEYRVGVPPKVDDVNELILWLTDELARVASAMQEFSSLRLVVLYAEPDKPRTGMLVYADGTSWNPGSGEGVYVRTSAGAWSKL